MSDQHERTLVLLRHAQAEQAPSATQDGDHERALTAPGLADAAAAGSWLREHDIAPTRVLCSTALRTRQTWAAVAESSGYGGLVDHEVAIYHAGAEALLELIRRADPDGSVLALVGHAPGIPRLAAALDDGSQPQVRAQLEQGYPPATLAVLRFEHSWDQLVAGGARLEHVITPGGAGTGERA